MAQIRPASSKDFDKIADLLAVCWPGQTRDAQELHTDESELEPHLTPKFWLAESGGQAVASLEVWRDVGSYDPRRWSIEVSVKPGHRNQGIGAQLFDLGAEEIAGEGYDSIACRVHEDDPVAIHFVNSRGFVEVKRDFISELDLTATEAGPVNLEGISIVSAAHLDSESFRVALHGLFEDVRKDVPRAAPPTPLSLDFFATHILNHHLFLIDATHVALDGMELVGFTGSFKAVEPGVIDQWLTGVRRSWRGRGVARALKVAAIRWAKDNGYRKIRTDNDSRNAAMLGLNQSLGFVRKTGIISLEFTPEARTRE